MLALCDGLVWAELGAAMPGAGGTYGYLREAFQYRTGRLMPFLFVWTAILFIPLIMSTGVYGFVSYLRYLWPSMTTAESDVVGLAAIVIIIALLWRRIDSIGKTTAVLWAIMIATLLTVIIAAYTHFHAAQVFTFPTHAFDVTSASFWVGFGGGLTIGVYDYLGYNTSAYLGAEIRRPGRVLPHSIGYAVLAMTVVYLAMQVGVLGVANWHEMLDTSSPSYTSVASVVLERTLGSTAAKIVTIFILVTADKNAPGLHPIELSLAWMAVGTLAFLVWARRKREWPFGPKTIDEQYLNVDPRLLELDVEEVTGTAGATAGR